ncbi:hypothetical protein [Umezawaea sp. NPDC059074]|uniref:hypothetical protein n=1 Tax=Umezawaea sp. NPDC059074 TaxID=3346716 RepID=UPI0036D0FA42
MNDQELTTGLMALADGAPPVDVDVDAVILQSRQGVRRRRAVVLAVVATVAVLGGVLAFGGPPAGMSPPPATVVDKGLHPYERLPSTPVPAPNVDVSSKSPAFEELLKTRLPAVVPGATTGAGSWGSVKNWDVGGFFVTIEGAAGGGITVTVFGPESSKVMRQLPPGTCVESARVPGEPVCLRQPDRSFVLVADVTGRDVRLPEVLKDPRAVHSEEIDSQRYRVATHYRLDGTIVRVQGNSPDSHSAPTAFSNEQLVAFATDPGFAF